MFFFQLNQNEEITKNLRNFVNCIKIFIIYQQKPLFSTRKMKMLFYELEI